MSFTFRGPVPPNHPMLTIGPSIVLRDELPEREPESESEQPEEDEQ